MTRHVHAQLVAVLLATALLVAVFAAPVAAGLPDPPDRPNGHGPKSGVGDVYDGSVFVIRTKDAKIVKGHAKKWDIPCGGKVTGSVTHENDYGVSLSGPLSAEEMNGVQQAVRDLRPDHETTKTRTVDLPDGKNEKKGTLKHTADVYRHVHYAIYIQRQAVPAQNELVGYVHIETFEKAKWKVTKRPCGGGGGGGGGRQPPVRPRPPKRPGPPSGGVIVTDDHGSDLTGHETADEATVLLSERFRNADVPGVAKGFVASKRLNVEVDGGTVGVRTDGEGKPVSVRTDPYGNPDGTVSVDEATLRDLERAEDPVAVARKAIARDRIEYSTADPVGQVAFYAAEAGLDSASFARDVAGGVDSFARGIGRDVGSVARGVASGL